jgi:hypothetical protein
VIRHGLYVDLERYRIDGRSALGQALAKSKGALAEMFVNGPDAAASLLINRIMYKALRLELFENWDMSTGEAKPTAVQQYIILSNSLRNDLNALISMTGRQVPHKAPDLHEYLAGLEKAE